MVLSYTSDNKSSLILFQVSYVLQILVDVTQQMLEHLGQEFRVENILNGPEIKWVKYILGQKIKTTILALGVIPLNNSPT